MANENELRAVRLRKIAELKEQNILPYAAKYERTHMLDQVKDLAEEAPAKIAGRLVSLREMGKLAFGRLFDQSGKCQVVFSKETTKNFELLKKIDIGDFIGTEGKRFTTKHGEASILVTEITFLSKALLPLPEKFHGLADEEAQLRQRYLDLISNEETMARFKFRSDFIRFMREFYWNEGFYEVETPTLMHSATGAAAKPYKTHNNGLDIDVYLRISHELPLKELIVGGFDKVFEIGKAFRNEGIDPSHLPEHTHMEHYCAYWDFEKNIEFAEKFFDYIFEKLKLEKIRTIKNKNGEEREVNFATPWQRVDFIAAVSEAFGEDIMTFTDADILRQKCQEKGLQFEGMADMGLTTLVDNIYKKLVRPNFIDPVIVYNYPKYMQPLARTNDQNQDIVDQFQIVVNGWELGKGYSELVDPVDQAERFAEQAKDVEKGDEEAQKGDDEFITALEHGAPPISGFGMGIDRIVTLLSGQDNLRDCVLFPLMRPVGAEKPEEKK